MYGIENKPWFNFIWGGGGNKCPHQYTSVDVYMQMTWPGINVQHTPTSKQAEAGEGPASAVHLQQQ